MTLLQDSRLRGDDIYNPLDPRLRGDDSNKLRTRKFRGFLLAGDPRQFAEIELRISSEHHSLKAYR